MIETERLLLRQPRLDDASELAAIFGDAENLRYIGGPQDAAAIPEMIEAMRARWERNGFGSLVAVRREDDRVVGRVGIFTWETSTWDLTRDLSVEHEVELGWLLGREYQGAGYATEAARGLRSWALAELDPPRLISLVNVENEASTAVAIRLGCSPGGRVETARFGLSEIWVHP